MGQELVRRSKSKPTPLWSARVLIDEAYVAATRDTVREQTKKGGVRLAKMLNEAFAK